MFIASKSTGLENAAAALVIGAAAIAIYKPDTNDREIARLTITITASRLINS